MKKLSGFFVLLSVLLLTSVTFSLAAEETPASSPLFSIERFVIAGSIEDREPVGIVNAFSSYTEEVYCFLEARDIEEDVNVSFVWYHDEKQTAKVYLPLQKGKRWRTYSSKKLVGRTGIWRVELHDQEGIMLDSVTFTVE